jgi:flagellar motor switch protein FliN/FliY
MIIDQNEIEALLTQADELREQTEATLQADSAAAAAARGTAAPPKQDLFSKANTKLKRVLRVRVPVIVELAQHPMPIRKIRRLSPGAIIEFDKSVEDDLTLYVRNRSIGKGHAIKVGEHFGLRITDIGTKRERINSLRG